MKQSVFGASNLKKIRELISKYKLIILFLVIGLFLLLLPAERDDAPKEDKSKDTVNSFELEELEERMEKILAQIDGAGELSLILTLKSGVEEVFAVDAEYTQDKERITERITTVLSLGDGGTKEPVIVRCNYPIFQGALVVCEGGDDPTVRLMITKAVSALTGLGADKITVCR
jgi:stage III sporulation protein AG